MPLAYLTVLGLCPLLSSAQQPPAQTPPSQDETSNQVSARELQIPEKAKKAFRKGSELFDAKQSAASIPEFRRAIKIFPDFYEAYYKIGLAELNLQQYSEAQLDFESAIEVSKGRYAPAQFGLGVALCRQQHYSEAEEAVRAGLDEYPNDPAGHFTLAWILFSDGQIPEAEKSARRAILYNANLAMAYLLLAQIHLRQNDLPAVTSDLDAYLRLDPNGPHNAEAKAVRAQTESILAKQKSDTPTYARIPQTATPPTPPDY
jgi:tetratricopeptide (TPR) repeat protein